MPENIWPQHAARLSGTWKCISFHMYDGTGPTKSLIAKPHGDAPLGRVQLSRNGYLSAHVANPATLKPLPSGKTWQEADAEEVARVAKGESMYCGQLQLFEDQEGLYWQTRVEIHSDSNRVGGIEERRVEYVEEGEKAYMILQPTRDMVMEVSFGSLWWSCSADLSLEGRDTDSGSAEVGEVRMRVLIDLDVGIDPERSIGMNDSSLAVDGTLLGDQCDVVMVFRGVSPEDETLI